MKTLCIIAEYNPFHNGHLFQLQQAKKETDADTVIVIMSGSFTLRGDLCIADKFTRANWAIKAGADCVLELPTVYTLSNATKFAFGALRTLKPLGDFTLSFGSESGDLQTLTNAVEFLKNEDKEFQTLFKSFMNEGNSVAKSRTLALSQQDENMADLISTPNNILGVEYINASKKLKMKNKFHTVKRLHSQSSDNFISSTEIRNKLKNCEIVSKGVPPFVDLQYPDMQKYNAISLYAINSKTSDELSKIANVREGFENRLKKQNFSSMSELMALTSKRYTRSTIKRIVASATLGLSNELENLANNEETYFRVLALNEGRKDILSLLGKSNKNLFLKASDCAENNPVFPLVQMDEKAHKLLQIVLDKID